MPEAQLQPNLGFYRKQAKELKRALAQRDAAVAARFVKHHPKFAAASVEALLGAHVSLGDAQHVIAREHGFASWSAFKNAVERMQMEPQQSGADRLLTAVRAGDVEAVRALCAASPELARTRDSRGVLALVEACDRGAFEIAKLLLDAGADPILDNPLLRAAHAGPHKSGPALDVVELLIERGAPDDIFLHASLNRVDALLRDITHTDIEARGPENSTALFLAAWNGQVEAVRVLLQAGADPNPICRAGQSAWEIVFLHQWSAQHRRVARLLLDHGVRCSLHEACILSHLPTVKRLLLEDPVAVNRSNDAGLTPLVIATLNADVELARFLLEAGASDPQGQGRALITAEERLGQSFDGAVFKRCSFQVVNFHDCTLKDATFSNVNLSGIRIDHANLTGAHIDNAGIDGMKIYGIEILPLLTKELERRAARNGRFQ
jgi:ankyrin repeat protein